MIDDAGPNTELLQRLKGAFESVDVDGSGTIQQAELKRKLEADEELQQLLRDAGGVSWSAMAQLDGDGDGEITWLEFEQLLTAPVPS